MLAKTVMRGHKAHYITRVVRDATGLWAGSLDEVPV